MPLGLTFVYSTALNTILIFRSLIRKPAKKPSLCRDKAAKNGLPQISSRLFTARNSVRVIFQNPFGAVASLLKANKPLFKMGWIRLFLVLWVSAISIFGFRLYRYESARSISV